MNALRVLLVDDNPQDRALVARELEKEYWPLEVRAAIDQRQLDQLLTEGEFDLVVTDFQLLWTDGVRVLRAVKARYPNCPVIMFTGTGSEEVAVEAMKCGLDDYIIKNVKHLVRLRAAVRNALEHAAVSRRANLLESQLSSLLSRLKVGVFRCQADGRLLEFNEAFSRIFALPPDFSRDDQKFVDLFAERGTFYRSWRNLINRRTAGEFEAEMQCPDGTRFWATIQLTVSETEGGNLTVEGMLEDVTDRKQNETALRRSEAELTHFARLSTIGEMVASIAHEINQPLGAIANFSAAATRLLVSEPPAETANVRDLLQQISEQAQRAANIIRELRQFMSRKEPARTPMDLNELIESAIKLMAHDANLAGIKLRVSLSEPSPQVIADRVQIQQVLVNLLRNAFEAMHETVDDDRVATVSTVLSNDQVTIRMSDRGHGLPSDIEGLFQPFVTTKADGMGMGLAISSTIIKTYGGTLNAASNEDGGATFYFTLPLARSDEDDS